MLYENEEIFWSDHFHERLMERFGLVIKPAQKIEIEEMIRNNELFCTLKNRQCHANVYGVLIEGQEVMVLFRPKLKTIVTAYRLNWFTNEGGVWVKNRPPLPKTKKPPRRFTRNKILKGKLNMREFREKIFSDQIEMEP